MIKKAMTALLCTGMLAGCSNDNADTKDPAAETEINSPAKQMKVGTMQIRDFGSIKMHSYNTKDLMDDYVFILEKAGKAVIIESPAFHANFDELQHYLNEKKIDVEGIFTPYHPLGATFAENKAMADTEIYMTQTVLDFWEAGFGSVMKQGIPKRFGKEVDANCYKPTVLLDEGQIKVADIEVIITDTYDGFNIEIPEIKAVYVHILGHDAHSEILGPEHLDEMIEKLMEYTENGYTTFLSSHYRPETNEDAITKIAYLKGMKRVFATSKTAEEFVKNMKAAYPEYKTRYLTPTASLLYGVPMQK